MTKYAPRTMFDAKYIKENDSHVYLFFFMAGKAVWVPKDQEYGKEWVGVKADGRKINATVSQEFSSRHELTGKNTYGTGKKKTT